MNLRLIVGVIRLKSNPSQVKSVSNPLGLQLRNTSYTI